MITLTVITLSDAYCIDEQELESQTFKDPSAQWLDYNTQQKNYFCEDGVYSTLYYPLTITFTGQCFDALCFFKLLAKLIGVK